MNHNDLLTPEQRYYHDHIRCQQLGCVLPKNHQDRCAMSFIGREDLVISLEEVRKLMNKEQ